MSWDAGLYRSIDSSVGLVSSITSVLTVYVSSAPVGVVLVRRVLAVSAMLCPEDTRSRLYVPSVEAETVTWYVSPEPETPVTGLVPVPPVLPGDRAKSDAVTPATSSLKVTL